MHPNINTITENVTFPLIIRPRAAYLCYAGQDDIN